MGGSLGKSKSKAKQQMNFDGQSQGSNWFDSGNQASALQNQQAQNQFGNQFQNQNFAQNQNQFSDQNQNQNQNLNQSQFGQNVWDPGGNTSGMYDQAGNVFDQMSQGAMGRVPGAADNIQGVMNNSQNPWQNQMQGGAYAGMPLQQNYQNALQGGGNEQFMNEQIMGGAGNNYVDAMKGELQTDSNNRLGQSLAMNDLRASGYGQSGSSRHGIAEARLNEDANDRLATQQTTLGYDTFAQDQQRKMDIARNADQFDMQKLTNTSGMLGQQQGAMQGGMNFAPMMQNLGMGQLAPYQVPGQMSSQALGSMGGPTVLGQGSSMGFGSGSGAGSSTGSASGMASDFGSGDSFGSGSSSGFGQNQSSGFGSGGGQNSSSGAGAGFGNSDSKGLGLSGGVNGGK